MKLIAVCNNVPDTIGSMLSDLKITNVKVHTFGTKVPKIPKHKYFFILSYTDLINNLKRLNGESYCDITVFLFCPVIWAKKLSNVKYLDVSSSKKTSNVLSYHYKDISLDLFRGILDSPFSTKKVKEIHKDFKVYIVNNILSGSLLNPLMTLLYSVKAETNILLKEMMFKYLTGDWSLSDLEKELNKTSEWGSVTKPCKTKLLELLKSDIGKAYRKCLTTLQTSKETKEPASINKLAKEHGIEVYEVKYILNTLMKQKKPCISGRTMDSLHKKELKVFKK